jgi:hypothetical protein
VEFPVALQPIYHLPCSPMSKDTNPPATKTDVTRLDHKLDTLIGSLNDIARDTDRRFKRLFDDIDRIVSILGHIDDRLTPQTRDHERRISRLEKKAGLAV